MSTKHNKSVNKFKKIAAESDQMTVLQLIYKYIEIYGVIAFRRTQRLTPKETEFMTCIVFLNYHDKDINESNTLKELKELMKFKGNDKSVYLYRDKLINKGWLIRQGKNVVIPRTLEFQKGMEGILVTFKATLNAGKS